MVKEFANAKINLFLDVTSKRGDGFHNIKSVMQSVSLCDTLFVSATASDKTEIVISSNLSELQNDENNLIYRSAKKYLVNFSKNAEVKITLEKNIPIGAGLGGGSTDAAATLRAMNKIFGLASEGELLSLAAEIGSDVPFCLIGGTTLCEGRGEILTPLDFDKTIYYVIAIGEERVSTPKAYSELDRQNPLGFAPNDEIAHLLSEIQSGSITGKHCYNIFESVTNLVSVSKIKEMLTKNGAECAMMSGSGPSVFGIFTNSMDAENARLRLVSEGFQAFTSTSQKGEKI